ncbi:hypothetical protein NADFUDRAFT_47178 [Nadsonia fulvescens var. elongata DSM 6958]|uniref:Ribosomal protein S2 n=1 Tax=Nadsonia fulvescens var. elongata DSM 6958 TaxID=857566 RepID=A0A1E3PGG5_9ASCO|nr:hypothetical protein NADFUDRAFT_47178 [Nadsonia fulvescens var. elongata DSM 6958]
MFVRRISSVAPSVARSRWFSTTLSARNTENKEPTEQQSPDIIAEDVVNQISPKEEAKQLLARSQEFVDADVSWSVLNELKQKSVLEYKSVNIPNQELENELNEKFSQIMKHWSGSGVNFDQIKQQILEHERNPLAKTNLDEGNVTGSSKKYPNLFLTGQDEPYSAQEIYLRKIHHQKTTASLGSDISNVYEPFKNIFYPPKPTDVTVSTLLAAGAHLGHSTSLTRSNCQPYLFGIRDGIHIIDLETTVSHLRRACKVIEGVAEKGGLILFVGTRPGQQRSLELAAQRSNGFYVYKRWVPGTITNFHQISNLWKRKEIDMGDNETGAFVASGLNAQRVKPDLVVILNPIENQVAVSECLRGDVPTIALIDTDSEPSMVTYPIPANDDSIRTTDVIVGILSRAAQQGKKRRVQNFEQHTQEKNRIALENAGKEQEKNFSA